MAIICAYHGPAPIEGALACLAHENAVLVGGGTKPKAAASQGPVEVVDLQDLRLDQIHELDREAGAIGATVTLQQLADSAVVPDIVREAARREQPSTLRNQATVGGCVMTGDFDSELLATLLVHDAVASITGPAGTAELTLQQLLADLPRCTGGILTAVTISTGGRAGADGTRRLALAGVAATPVLVDGADRLDPPADFRGSSEYRRALAAILMARALEAI